MYWDIKLGMVDGWKRNYANFKSVTQSIIVFPEYPQDLPKELYDKVYSSESPPVSKVFDNWGMYLQHIPLRTTSNLLKIDQGHERTKQMQLTSQPGIQRGSSRIILPPMTLGSKPKAITGHTIHRHI